MTIYESAPYIILVLLVAMGLIAHSVNGNNSTTTEEVKKTKKRGRPKKK